MSGGADLERRGWRTPGEREWPYPTHFDNASPSLPLSRRLLPLGPSWYGVCVEGTPSLGCVGAVEGRPERWLSTVALLRPRRCTTEKGSPRVHPALPVRRRDAGEQQQQQEVVVEEENKPSALLFRPRPPKRERKRNDRGGRCGPRHAIHAAPFRVRLHSRNDR